MRPFRPVLRLTAALLLLSVLAGCHRTPEASGDSGMHPTLATLPSASATDTAAATSVTTATSATATEPTTAPPPEAPLIAYADLDIAALMALDNTKSGYGWANSPSRQPYYDTYGAYAIGDRTQPVVYLTFDEGYEYRFTPRILDVLRDKQVQATFFITMDYAKRNPELVERMIREGHAVGNHSTTHPSMPDVTLEQAYRELCELHVYVQQEFDYTMHLFRFPSGEASDRTLALVQAMGYTSVFWSFAHRDWDPANQPQDYEAVLQSIHNYTQNGTIYLLHAVSETNTELLPAIIDQIRGEGYRFGLLP